MRKTLLLSFFSLVILLSACSLVDKEESMPAFIAIEDVILNTDQNDQGSNSQQITDVWAFVNDLSIGTYELPIEFPVLASGLSKIRIDAGIQDNGISSTKVLAPFFQPFVMDLDLTPLAVHAIVPQFSYKSDVNFKLINDFESSSSIEAKSGSAPLTSSDDPEFVFEGNRSGVVRLNASNSDMKIGTILNYTLPTSELSIYLEFDYKCTQLFQVYLTGFSSGASAQAEILNLRATEDWNKVYVSLRDAAISFDADFYEIGFLASLRDSSAALFQFDNIKLHTL